MDARFVASSPIALRRAGRAFWVVTSGLAVLASFGVLGLAVALVLVRSGRGRRVRHAASGVVWVMFAMLLVGALAKGVEDARGVPPCRPPAYIELYARDQGEQLAVSITPVETVMTWPTSGLLILYADVSGANLCYFEPQEFYLARFGHWPLPRRAIFVANVFLSRQLNPHDIDGGLKLASHEVGHREQWAVGTLIGGPFAFPAAYTVDDFFFPGPKNHFERAAGLKSGGYDDESSPRLRVAEAAFFALIAAAFGAAAIGVRNRHQPRSTR